MVKEMEKEKNYGTKRYYLKGIIYMGKDTEGEKNIVMVN